VPRLNGKPLHCGNANRQAEAFLQKSRLLLKHGYIKQWQEGRSNAHKLESKPEQLSGTLFDRLFRVAEISNFTTEEVSEYEASLMNRWDYSASMKFAEEEGIAIGEARNEAKNQAKIESLFSLLEAGVPLAEAKRRFSLEN